MISDTNDRQRVLRRRQGRFLAFTLNQASIDFATVFVSFDINRDPTAIDRASRDAGAPQLEHDQHIIDFNRAAHVQIRSPGAAPL